MDIETIIKNMMTARRHATLSDSPQLTLGEFLLKLEAVKDKNKIVFFDFKKMKPGYYRSWRGSYEEIALGYDKDMTDKDVWQLIDMSRKAIGKTYEGYKGGEFTMNKNTPIWVDNYGESGERGITDVIEKKDKVVIKTGKCEF